MLSKLFLSIWNNIIDINRESSISVSSVNFADPQGGISICDRRATYLKSIVGKYVNEGNDVRTASEFLAAIKNSNSVNTCTSIG